MTKTRSEERWQVYILRCRDGSLYTGVTTDLDRRVDEHNRGARGARYTRSRRPVALVYSEPAPDRAAAQRREHALRRLSATARAQLIEPDGDVGVKPAACFDSVRRKRRIATDAGQETGKGQS